MPTPKAIDNDQRDADHQYDTQYPVDIATGYSRELYLEDTSAYLFDELIFIAYAKPELDRL